MFKDVLQLRSEEMTKFLALFGSHLGYLRNDIANKRGKYSTDIRREFFKKIGIQKPHKNITDEEKEDFNRKCRDLRELRMENLGGKITYNWHRCDANKAFNSDLLVAVLGITFGGSSFKFEETRKTKPVTVTLYQLAFTFYTIQRVIAPIDDVNLSKEYDENARCFVETRNYIYEILNREKTTNNEPYWLLERVKVMVPIIWIPIPIQIQITFKFTFIFTLIYSYLFRI